MSVHIPTYTEAVKPKERYFPFVDGVGQCKKCGGWYLNESQNLKKCTEGYICRKCRKEAIEHGFT